MDRFRFEVVNTSQSEPNGRSSSVGAKAPANKNLKALDKIRKSGKVTHCTYNESLKQLLLLIGDQLQLYDFNSQSLSESIKIP